MKSKTVPLVEVKCIKCGIDFPLPADHPDVANFFPGPMCHWCEEEECEEEDEEDGD